MNLDIQVYDREVMDLFRHMVQAGGDLSPVTRDIADVLVAGIELAFDRETDPNSDAKWKPLHPMTIAERQLAGNWPGKILQRSGHLVSSVVPDSGADFAAAGTNVIYAAMQNFGGKVTPKKGKALSFGGGFFSAVTIPARPFAGIWPESLAEIDDMLSRYIVGDF
jgi:phage virion morphogenesis protein